MLFKNFKDFNDHYLKKDVLLLAAVFQIFICSCLKNFNLDPWHYFSAPGLSWDAMLKITKVELEKVSDADMHILIERGMRGGTSYVSKKHSEANNEYCLNYDKNKAKVHINYLDMNNLYRDATSEYLPYGGFKWVKVTKETVNKILNKSDNGLYGYFLEVDLDYPEEFYDSHNVFPMAPAKIKIEDDMLSPYSFEIKKECDIKSGGINKLVPNLIPKKNYVVHYRNLQYYLSQDLILKRYIEY